MHYEKYKKGAVGHELAHDDRTAQNNINKNIDKDKTPLNYNLCEHGKGIDYYTKRLSEVKCQNRADVNTLCSWILTLPKGHFTDEEERAFFQAGYDEFTRRYGKENCVSAYVHKDEAGQPHLHYKFIPVVDDKKHPGRKKVSAKEAVTREDLKRIHGEMEKAISRELGRDIVLLNGATASGNRTVQELKAQTLESNNRELDLRIAEKQLQFFDSERKLANLESKILQEEEVRAITAKKKLFSKKHIVELDYQDYQDLQKTALRVKGIDDREERVRGREKRIQSLEDTLERDMERKKLAIDKAMESYVQERSKSTVDVLLKNVDFQERFDKVCRFLRKKGLYSEFEKLDRAEEQEKLKAYTHSRHLDRGISR